MKTLNCPGNNSGGVFSVAFDSTYLLASGSSDNSVKIWDTNSGNQLKSLTGHSDQVLAVAIDSNNMLASGSYDKSVKLWDKHNGDLLRSIIGHVGVVWSVAFAFSNMLKASIQTTNYITPIIL